MTLESGYLEKGSDGWKSTSLFSEVSGVSVTILENQGETLISLTRDRSIPWLAVLITAAGLQGEQPLVTRIMWVREVGKSDP